MTVSTRLAAHQSRERDRQSGFEGMSLSTAQRALVDVATGSPGVQQRGIANLVEFMEERAPGHSQTVSPASRSGPASSTSVKAKTTTTADQPARVFTSSDLAIARQRAREEERVRVAAVFASEHSKGRERACATLLAHQSGRSAAEIIAFLPEVPKDGTTATMDQTRCDPNAAAIWEGAYARAADTTAPSSGGATTSAPTIDDVWANAYGSRQNAA